jgi:hypothetical protein
LATKTRIFLGCGLSVIILKCLCAGKYFRENLG